MSKFKKWTSVTATCQQQAKCQHLLAKQWSRPGLNCQHDVQYTTIKNWVYKPVSSPKPASSIENSFGTWSEWECFVCIRFTRCSLLNWLTTNIKSWMLGVYFCLYLWSGSSPAHSGVCTAISRASFVAKFSCGWAFPDFWLYCSRRLLCFCLKNTCL